VSAASELREVPKDSPRAYEDKRSQTIKRKKVINMETKTNVVLVDGAFADGSSWGKVIPLLQKKGFDVTAVQLPLTSLSDDIAATRNVLSMQKCSTDRKGFLIEVSSFSSLGLPIAVLRIVVDKIPTSR
jgi:hypothetical protein